MVEEAERYAEEDKRRRDEAEKLNAADSIAYQAEKLLADFGAKLSADQKSKIESALREIREALAKRDAALATERSEALKRILQEAGAALYSEASQAGPEAQPNVSSPSGEARPTGSGPRGRVVDAEYKEQ
jgi:molecular chaperone DnaK